MKTGLFCHLADFSSRVFMAALRPDGLSFPQFDRESRTANFNFLRLTGTQVHFHAASRGIEAGFVSEVLEDEVPFQLAIDPSQKIQIERRRDTKRIVVRGQQLPSRFLEVGSKQETISGAKGPAHSPQKIDARRTIEVANGAAQEKNEDVFVLGAPGRDFDEAIEV